MIMIRGTCFGRTKDKIKLIVTKSQKHLKRVVQNKRVHSSIKFSVTRNIYFHLLIFA